MVRKSKKVVETPEEIEETLEVLELEETPVETPVEIEEIPEVLEEIQVQENNNDIKTVLKQKRKVSEKQREHLQKSREIMIQKERQKKF